MEKVTVINKVNDLPEKLDIMEYLVVVSKHSRFVQAILFEGYSGHAMQDVITDFYRQFPRNQGYVVEW